MNQKYPQLPWSTKDKVIGKIYTYKNRQCIWNGNRLNCVHNNRFERCKTCKGEEITTKRIFKNQESIRLFMENLLSKITKQSNIDYETTKLWYQLNRQMVSKNGGNSLFGQYRTLLDILQSLYPNNRLYPCLFKTVPTNTWNDYKNHIIWVREFLKKMNITNYEDCYKIKCEDICNNGGATLLNVYHDYSVYTLFKNTLIYNWLPWKYTNAPQGMWIGGNVKNVKWYFKELYKDLDFTSLDDFYKINKHTLIKNNGGGLLSIYNGSIYNLLHIAYPEYNWKFWKLSQAPRGMWDNINNQRIFMDEFHTALKISSQTEMYYLLLEEINNYGGSTLTNTIYNQNIYKLYSSIYPELEWDKDKFFKKYQLCNNIENCSHNCYNRSLASHPYASKSYSSDNNKPISSILLWEDNPYLFTCYICNHNFTQTPHNIQNGAVCPYCRKCKPLLCGEEHCNMCYMNSLASSPLSQYVINNSINLRLINRSSSIPLECKCPDCNYIFLTQPQSLTRGRFCPICINKTARKLYTILITIFPNLVREFKAEWCINPDTGYYLRFDYCILELKIIIELDGGQHFYDVKFFKQTFMEQHERDIYKEKCANDNGYHMIRILQEDVLYDKNDWLENLLREIEYIKNNQYDIHNRYICDNNEYDIFM